MPNSLCRCIDCVSCKEITQDGEKAYVCGQTGRQVSEKSLRNCKRYCSIQAKENNK